MLFSNISIMFYNIRKYKDIDMYVSNRPIPVHKEESLLTT